MNTIDDEHIAGITGEWADPSPKRSGKVQLVHISADDLRDNARLSTLYIEAVSKGWWTNSDASVQTFWSFAEKALEDDERDTPGKLFYALIKKKNTSKISEKHDTRAMRRMPSQARRALVEKANQSILHGKAKPVTSSLAAPQTKQSADPQPPAEPVPNLQYEMFSSFLSNDMDEVSNTIERWERIPKYFLTPKQVTKLRTPDGGGKPFKWEYVNEDNIKCKIIIQPAFIEQKDGSFKACYPGITEEFIEEALKKIFTEQNCGLHVPEEHSWVRWTLGMLSRELKDKGRARNISQIKDAIQIMGRCNLSYYENGDEIWSGSILQDLCTVGREEYEVDSRDRKKYHIARLPIFVTNAINRFEYRQYNYGRYMRCDTQLARYIYKRMINRFTGASDKTEQKGNQYRILYSTLKHTGLLQQHDERSNRTKVIETLEDLKDRGVISGYAKEDRKGDKHSPKKVTDVLYTLTVSEQFTKEQKAANKRILNHELERLKHGIRPLPELSTHCG